MTKKFSVKVFAEQFGSARQTKCSKEIISSSLVESEQSLVRSGPKDQLTTSQWQAFRFNVDVHSPYYVVHTTDLNVELWNLSEMTWTGPYWKLFGLPVLKRQQSFCDRDSLIKALFMIKNALKFTPLYGLSHKTRRPNASAEDYSSLRTLLRGFLLLFLLLGTP